MDSKSVTETGSKSKNGDKGRTTISNDFNPWSTNLGKAIRTTDYPTSGYNKARLN